MPIYMYQCKKCGEHFEVEQRMTDDALTTHDSCGGNVVKVFSSAGIVFKGSGFHKTDSRSTSKKSTISTQAKPSETTSEASAPPSTQTSTSSSPTDSASSNTSPPPKTNNK